ncbi:hypothetical protein NC652_021089 [Populus alba x Populus x berolinensis]|nr:hypothetical protein NC652_021089 [Populus alba x Populus x berolinensis]
MGKDAKEEVQEEVEIPQTPTEKGSSSSSSSLSKEDGELLLNCVPNVQESKAEQTALLEGGCLPRLHKQISYVVNHLCNYAVLSF